MKKKLIIAMLLLFVSGMAFSQVNFGIGGAAGSKSGIKAIDINKVNFGVHARVMSSFAGKIGVIGGFTYFFPSKADIAGGSIETKLMEFNADVFYSVFNKAGVQLYGLGGLVFSSLKYVTSAVSTNNGELGWEAGVGVKLKKVFIEAKYDNRMQQMVGIVGFYF